MKVYTQLAPFVALVAICFICFISQLCAENQAIVELKAWLISFHDTAESSKVEAVTNWLNQNNYPIDTAINESYIKFVVANMTSDGVTELERQKNEFGIESIELDDLVWDSMDKSEL